MFDPDDILKNIFFISLSVSLGFLVIGIFWIYAKETKKDAARKKAKAETLKLKPGALIPSVPIAQADENLPAIEKEWRDELLAFTSFYVNATKNAATKDDARFAYACQEAAYGCAGFRSIHEGVLAKEREDRHGAMLGMRNRIDDLARARGRINHPERTDVALYTPQLSDLETYKERYNEIGRQIDGARDTLARLDRDHEVLAPKAQAARRQAELLLLLVEKNMVHAERWSEDKEILAYLMSDIARDLDRAEHAANEPEKLLASGESDTETFARGVRRLIVLSKQSHELNNEIEKGLVLQPVCDLASQLLKRANVRKHGVLMHVGENGPKDWSAISQRIWHSVHETELALWIACKVPTG